MKDILNNFRKDFENTVKELERKYGFEVKLGSITYNPGGTSFEGKISAIKIQDGKTGEQIKFEKEAEIYGFKPEDYKKEYVVDNKKYLLVGFNAKATKNKYIIQDVVTGTKYNCDSGYLGLGKLTMSSTDEEDRKRKEFEFNAFMFGFKPSDYKKEFTKEGKTYQLIGFKPKARKNTCIIMDMETNKQYVCPKEFII